ncbi:MAG: MarR family transcriptional regulator [Pseudomonadota bacterium]
MTPPDTSPVAAPRLRAELDLFSAIERGEVVSQSSLTRRVGVSIGMINALVKRAVGKGYAKMRQAPYKRYAYYLTPQGFAEKSRLVAAYLETSLSFFRKARLEYEAIFASPQARGAGRILLVGEGELLEIAVLAAMVAERPIAGVLSTATGSGPLGLARIATPRPDDLLVITDQAAPQDAYERARIAADTVGAAVVAPTFLRITPDRDALMARVDADQAAQGERRR